MMYNNADLEKSSVTIVDLKKTEVHRWINKINGKCYIGSSVNLFNRFYLYFNLKAIRLNLTIYLIAKALIKRDEIA